MPKLAFEAPFRDTTVWQMALDVLQSRGGIAARAEVNPFGQDETLYLERCFELVHDRKTVADELLEALPRTLEGVGRSDLRGACILNW